MAYVKCCRNLSPEVCNIVLDSKIIIFIYENVLVSQKNEYF